MTPLPPNLAETHEQYPDGFPARLNDELLGHWPVPDGRIVVVENHPHGYEVHFGPCYDLAACDACAPDRGPSNPHTSDGHHFRLCPTHEAIVTVAGGEIGYRAVLEYLATEGSPQHVAELAALRASEAAAEVARLEQERAEAEADAALAAELAPSPEERLAALEAELAALRAHIVDPTAP